MTNKMVLCPKGHYYDNTKFAQCPVCRNSAPLLETKPATRQAESSSFRTVSDNQIHKNKTTMPVLGKKNRQNITGWLVTISGPEKGKDHRIFTGYNYIGRSIDNQIQIVGDETISREKQATIIYDHKNTKYYFQHNEGHNLSYINKNPVLQPIEIKRGDRITIGKTDFIFIPFCDDSFSWNSD